MAMGWKAVGISLDEARDELRTALGERSLPDWASYRWVGDELHVEIRKGGTSTFRLALEAAGAGCRIVERKRKVSMLHRPFVGVVEDFVDEAMRAAGFTRA